MNKSILKTISLITTCALLLIITACKEARTSEDGINFIMSNNAEPQSLDPTQIEGMTEENIYVALFEGLVSYDPKTCTAIPGVAESWERNATGETVTFHLRDCTFSDGTPITAQTVLDSWLYYLSPKVAATYAYMPCMVIKGAFDYNAGKTNADSVGIKAIDDKTFQVSFIGPCAYGIDMLAHFAFPILPMHAIKEYGADWIKPGKFVGNGPFTLSEWIPQDHITAVKNENYWNKDNVFLSSVTFLPIENANTAYQKYKQGEIDWANNIPTAILDEAMLRDDSQIAAMNASYFYSFNMNNPVLKDIRVRKALTMAIDRKTLVEKVTKAGEIPTDSLTPPMPGFTPSMGNPYDVKAAQQLLADAGYPNGKGLETIQILYNTSENHKKIAEFVQQQLKENLGIDIELANMEWATFVDTRQGHEFQIARNGWVGDYQDPSNFLEMFLSTGGNNDGAYNNPEFDKLLQDAARLPASEERNALLSKAEDILCRQDQAIIPFYYYTSKNMINLDKWEGWYTNTMDVHPFVGIKLREE
jgi:oligopeptide transport system substrate-binding protein